MILNLPIYLFTLSPYLYFDEAGGISVNFRLRFPLRPLRTIEFFVNHDTTAAIAPHGNLSIKFSLSGPIHLYKLQKPKGSILHPLVS
jgi:hypothetical protein